MFGKLADLEAQCGILDEKMRKFNAKEDEIKSAMAGLKKEHDDLKMSLLKAGVREKQLFFCIVGFIGYVCHIIFSNVHIVGEP